MAMLHKVAWTLFFNWFVTTVRGQELTAEVLSVRLPKPTYGMVSVYKGQDSIYIIGGFSGTLGKSKDILKLSLNDETITREALLPYARSFGSGIIDNQNENIYYFGGWDGDIKREIYEFNLAKKSVTIVGNLTIPTAYHAGVKYTDQTSKVFLIGGDPTFNFIQCWDIDLNSNCPTQTIDTNFYHTSAVTYGNDAFVFSNANNTSGGVPVYKINLNTFDTSYGENALPNIPYSSTAVIVGTNAYIIGGWENQTNFPTNSIIQVDLDSLKVIALKVNNFIPIERFYGASAVYVENYNRIYVLGGYSDPHGFHDEIWSIHLTPIYVPPTTNTIEITQYPVTSSKISN